MPRFLQRTHKGLAKRGIKEARLRELYYFSIQYESWLKNLNKEGISESEKSSLLAKIELVENCTKLATEEINKLILIYVTTPSATAEQLILQSNAPCDTKTLKQYKNKYYLALDKVKK